MPEEPNDNAPEFRPWGPLPALPIKVDLVTWLLMSSQERAEHLRRHNETERESYFGLGFSEAKIERQMERTTRHWDHLAALLAMGSEARIQRLRRDVEAERPHYLSLGMDEAELERRTASLIKSWDELEAAAKRRREAGTKHGS